MGLDNSPLFFPFPSLFYSLFLPAMPPVSFSSALAQPGPVPPLPPPPLSSFSPVPQPLCPLTTPDPPSPFSLPSVAPFSQASPLATLPLGAGPPQAPATYTLPPSSPMATPAFLPDLIGPPISPAALALASPMISPALKGAPSSSAPLSLVALAPSSAEKNLDASPSPMSPSTPGTITSLLTPTNPRIPIPKVASTSATPPDVVTALPSHLGIPLASESNAILQRAPSLPVSIQAAPVATPSLTTMAPKAPSAAFTLSPPVSHAEQVVSSSSGASAQISSDDFLKLKSPTPITIPLGISSQGSSTSSTTLGSPVTLFPKDPLVSPVVSSSPAGSPFSLLMPPVQKDPSSISIVPKLSSGQPFVATSPPAPPTYPLPPPVLSLGPKAPSLESPSLKGTPTPVVTATQVATLTSPTVTATVPISLEGGNCPLGSHFIPSDSADSKPKKDHVVLPTALPLSTVVPKDPSIVQIATPSLKTPVSSAPKDLKESSVVPISPLGVSTPIQADSPTKKVPVTLPLTHMAPQSLSTCSLKSSPGSPSQETATVKKDLVGSSLPAAVPSPTVLTAPAMNADNSTPGTSKVPVAKIDLSAPPLASPLVVPDSSSTTPAIVPSPQGLLFSSAQMDSPAKKNPGTPLTLSPVAPKETTSTPAAPLSPLEFALSSAPPKDHMAKKGPISPESPHFPSTVALSPLGASVTPQIPEVLRNKASSAVIPASLTLASVTPQSAPVPSVLPVTTNPSTKETSDSPGVATSPLETTVTPNRSPLASDLASATPSSKGSPTSPLVTPPHKGAPTLPIVTPPPSPKRASTISPALPHSAPKEAPTTPPATVPPSPQKTPTAVAVPSPAPNGAPTTPPAAMPPSPKGVPTTPAMPPAPKEVPTAAPLSPKGAPTTAALPPAPKEAPVTPSVPSSSSKGVPSAPPIVPSSPKGSLTHAVTTSSLETTASSQVPKGSPSKKGSATSPAAAKGAPAPPASTSLSPKVTSDSSSLETPVSAQTPKGSPAKKGSATSPAAAKGSPAPPASTSPSSKGAPVSPQTSKRSLPKKDSAALPDLDLKEFPTLSDVIPPPKDGPMPSSPKSASSTVLTVTPKGATNHTSEVVSPLGASVSPQTPKGLPTKKGSAAPMTPKSTPVVPTPKGPSAKKGHPTSPLGTSVSPAASPAPSTNIGTTGAPLGQKGTSTQASKGPPITEKEEGPVSSSKDITVPAPAPSSPLVAATESNLTKAESASLSPAPIPPVSLLLVPSPVPPPLLPKQQPLLPSSPGLVPEAPCKPQAPADEDELPPLIPPEPPSGGVPFQPVLVDMPTPKPTGVPAPIPPAKQPVLKNDKGIRLGLPCAWCVARTLLRATHQY
ncbi:nascent polypeptide-associated complex subunit alpha, muscle-specific form-like isoform X2 [Petaurus breviceps papuanus]|uniref:nascent polypeptide-associated complex subunit alpha, muscle-specific form-like isoform X2 n=1 Tax=Petaurus breviceps papuanus TaxID=3040969 RepID=UPI0036D89DD6